MQIETKFSIGDTIWISDCVEPSSHTVVGILAQIAENYRGIRYKIRKDDTHVFIFEQLCFNSYEECEKAINQQKEERRRKK